MDVRYEVMGRRLEGMPMVQDCLGKIQIFWIYVRSMTLKVTLIEILNIENILKSSKFE